MCRLAHHGRAWIVVLVDAVPEAHQAEAVILVLGLFDIFRDAVHAADFVQHVEAGLIGAAMARAPQTSHASGNGREWVRARRAGEADGRGGRVLLVIGMQDEEAVHCFRNLRIDLVVFSRDREAHAEEVLGIGQLVARIDEFLAHIVLQDAGAERWHLGDQTDRGEAAFFRVFAVHGAGIEGRHCADRAGQHGHRMAVTAEAFEEAVHLGVEQGVLLDLVIEGGEVGFGGQLAVQDQVADFREGCLRSQLANRIAAVQQDTFFPINERDLAFTARRGGEARVKGELAGLRVEFAHIHDVRPMRAGQDGHVIRFAVNFNLRCTSVFGLIFHQL